MAARLLECPTCKTIIELPHESASAFQSNFYIGADSGEKFTCDICGPGSIASSRCLDCEENLCQVCSRVHQKSKATKHHKLSDLGTFDPEMKGKIRQRVFCEKHPEEEIRLVCQKCDVAICVLCKVLNHDTHVSKTVADAASELQQRLEAKLSQCAEKLVRLDICAQTGEELERKINAAEREDLKAFEEQYSKLLKFLNQEAANMKDKITSIYGVLKNENVAFKADVQNDTQRCSNANASARKLIDQGTHIEKIQMVPDLELLIAEATSKSDPKPMPSLMLKLFSPAAIMPTELSSLIGVVQDSAKVSLEGNKEEEFDDGVGDSEEDKGREIVGEQELCSDEIKVLNKDGEQELCRNETKFMKIKNWRDRKQKIRDGHIITKEELKIQGRRRRQEDPQLTEQEEPDLQGRRRWNRFSDFIDFS